MAPARVCFTLGAYLGLARNVSCPGPACSMPATPDDFQLPIALQAAAEGIGNFAQFHSKH